MKRLTEIFQQEQGLAHIELHDAREAFIRRVDECYGIDQGFDALVDGQLAMYVDEYVDPRTFYAVCNEPRHRIRNMLLCWDIDHRNSNGRAS